MRKINIISGDFTVTQTHTYGKNVEMEIENLGDGEGFHLIMNATKATYEKPKRKWRWF